MGFTDDLAIRNTISWYCIALDTKDFDILHRRVFVKDVEANYPFNPHFKGVDDVAAAIEQRLRPCTSQHALTTQVIELMSDSKAKAVTYFTGVHFGTGKWKGKQVTAHGKYDDELVKEAGGWRISKRTVAFMGRVGEEGVMEPQD